MKLLLITLLSALNAYSSTSMDLGTCTPDYSSKKYIKNNFQENYPKDVVFKCNYSCKSKNGIDLVVGISRMTISSVSEDAKRVVCDGVKVKKVPWGWDFDGVEPFYAYDTRVDEIKKWAFANIDKNNKYELSLLKKLKRVLTEAARGYLVVNIKGYEYYPEAGSILLDIASGLPQDTKKLDFYINSLKQNSSMLTKEGLVAAILFSNARFRVSE